MDAFIKLLNDDIDVLKYTTVKSTSYYCIAEKGSNDIDKALRETLQKLIDAGATDAEIEAYTGLTKRLTNPDYHINVGSGYVFNGLIRGVTTIKQDFHRFKIGDWVKSVCMFLLFLLQKAVTNRSQAVFSFSPTSYSISDRTRQFLLTALSKSLDFKSSYRNT